MPTFQGQISDEQLNALVAYVKSLGQQPTGQTGGRNMATATPKTQ
jgi:mono/diheme cytochrome c family protein